MFISQQKFNGSSGFSLVELIVAIAIFGFLATALIILLVDSYSTSWRGGQRIQALAYAKEGLEAVWSIRRQAWNQLENGEFGVQNYAGFWQWSTTTADLLGANNEFTRIITISDIYRDAAGEIVDPSTAEAKLDLHTKKISSKVNWEIVFGINTEVKLITYLTNWQSKDWLQADWSQGSGQEIWSNVNQYFADDGNIDYSSAGEIKLKRQTGTIFWGNQFLLTDSSLIGRMTRPIYKTSLRFTAQADKVVKAIKVYFEQEVGESPTYRYGLQTDDNGNPSGIWIGISGQGYGDWQANTIGWQTITLNEPVGLNAGQIYHLVIQWRSGTIKGNYYIALRRSNPLNALIPYNQTNDPSANTLFSTDGGISWSVQNYQPIYILEYTDDTYEGNPYDYSQEVAIYGQNFVGEIFSLKESATTTQVSFYIKKNKKTPQGNLLVTLESVTSGTVIEQGILAIPIEVDKEYSWLTYEFSSPKNLSASEAYRLYLNSPDSDFKNYYQIYKIINFDNFSYNEVNFDSLNSFFSSSDNGGINWETDLAADLSGFRLGLETTEGVYALEGWLESSAFNTESLSSFNILSWTEYLPTANEDVWVQLATAPDNFGQPEIWTNWLGPTGAGSYYQDSQEILIPKNNNHNDHQWVKYRVILKGEGSATPVLRDIKVNYTP